MGGEHGLGSWQRIDLIFQLPVSTGWKCLLVAITWHEAMRDGICRAAVGTLAKEVSASRRWVGMQLEPMQSAGLIAIDQRRNGAHPVIEVCWSEIQQMVNETCAPQAQVKTQDGKTRALCAQVQRSDAPTCESQAQVEIAEPLRNPFETETCANGTSDLRKPDTQPAQMAHEPAHAVRTSVLSVEEVKERECGSRQALTPPPRSPEKIPGSTLTPEEIEMRKRFVEEVRPDWAKKGTNER